MALTHKNRVPRKTKKVFRDQKSSAFLGFGAARANKKGVFYTITAIILLLLIIATFIISTSSNEARIKSTQARVMTMNNLVQNIERDVYRGLHIANMRALISIEKKITSEGDYIDNAEASFITAIVNGTIENETMELMENSTFPLWIARIEQESAKIGVDVNITIDSINVFQDNPWSIKTGVNITLILIDLKQTSRWNRQKYIESEIFFEGYEDPVYALSTLGRIYNKVVKSPYDDNWTDATRNDHLLNSYYVNHTDAPSFLMRLEGNVTGTSPYGIESMVNIDELIAQDLDPVNMTVIDHHYFNGWSGTDSWKSGMPAWFRIDGPHDSRYGW